MTRVSWHFPQTLRFLSLTVLGSENRPSCLGDGDVRKGKNRFAQSPDNLTESCCLFCVWMF